jgi:hypothetical protein
MGNLVILIDDQEIDYQDNDDFPLRFRRELADYKDPANRKGEVSYTLKLPNSTRNRLVFGSLQILEQSYKFQSLNDRKCVVTVGDIEVFRGVFKIKSVSDTTIEGFMVAKVGSIAVALKGKSLRDLTGFGELGFNGCDSIISQMELLYNNFQNPTDFNTDTLFCFPLVCRGKFFMPNVWSSSNLTTYLPSTPYVPFAPQSNTTINLPEGREIFGNKTYYLDYRSAPHLGFRDIPPSFFVVPILKQIFANAGYQLQGNWINSRRVKKLVMPYSAEREFIYNWQSLGTVISASNNNQSDTAQSVGIVWDGDQGNLRFAYAWSSLYYDRQYKLSNVLYPTNAPPVSVFAQQYSILYNVLHFEYAQLDNAFLVSTNHDLDNENNFKWSTYTAPVDGVYTFQYSFLIERNSPHGAGNSGRRFATRRKFGATKFQGDIPNNLDGGRTFTEANVFEDNIYLQEVIDANIGDVISGTFTAELKRGESVVFWISLLTFISDFEHDSGNLGIIPGDPVVPYADPYFIFSTIYLSNPAYVEHIAIDTVLSVRRFRIQVNIDNLPSTPERDRFGSNLKVAQNLPDVQQIEFLQSFQSLFNLYLSVDEKKRIAYLDPADTFFLPTQTAYDITQKTNRSTFVSSPPDLNKQYNFIWQKDSKDDYASRIGANYDYLFDTNISNNTDVSEVGSGIFALTEFDNFGLAVTEDVSDFTNPQYQSATTVRIPHLATKDDLSAPLNESVSTNYDFQPRLLQIKNVSYFDDQNPTLGIPLLVKVFEGLTGTVVDQYATLTRFAELSFADTNNVQNINLSWNSDSGLYRNYYQYLMTDLTRGFEATCEVLMNAIDYNEMQINRPIRYDGNIFYLKSITAFNPIRPQKVKITLIKRY